MTEETHTKSKADKNTYRARRRDYEEISATMHSIESWATQVAGISSLYGKRCLINAENSEELDIMLRDITADAITDLRAAFNKLARGDELLATWLEQNKPSLFRLLFT
tara:strand:+ start:350 stop:673 length:324 start_codon:yes stop_codon:yes gene_type:complete